MANINDVYNRLGAVDNTLGWVYKAVLAGTAETTTVDTDIKAGTTAMVNALKTLDNDVKTLDSDVKAGFAATANALTVLAEIETAAVNLLFHLTQQADTMICELGQISKNTCGILTQTTIQTGLQKSMREKLEVLVDIEEAVNPAASLQLERLLELRAQIEKCCPPRPPERACTYSACPAPQPIGQPKLPVVGQPSGGETNIPK